MRRQGKTEQLHCGGSINSIPVPPLCPAEGGRGGTELPGNVVSTSTASLERQLSSPDRGTPDNSHYTGRPEGWPPTGTRPQVLECTPCCSAAGVFACELGKPLIMLETWGPGEEKRLLGGQGLPQAWAFPPPTQSVLSCPRPGWQPGREGIHQDLAEAATKALTWEVLRERREQWTGYRKQPGTAFSRGE